MQSTVRSSCWEWFGACPFSTWHLVLQEGAFSCRRDLAVKLGPLPLKEPVVPKEPPQEEAPANGQFAPSTGWEEEAEAVKMSKPDPGWEQAAENHQSQSQWPPFSSSGGLHLSNALGRQIIVLTNEDLRKQIVLGSQNQALADDWQKMEFGGDGVVNGEGNKTSWRKIRRFFRRDPHEWSYSHDDEESMLDPSAQAAFASELWLNVRTDAQPHC